MDIFGHIRTLAVLALAIAGGTARVIINEPKGLRLLYLGEGVKYSVMNFGRIPYGQTVSGLVLRATPADGCAPLQKLEYNRAEGAPIVFLERGNCNFAEKVLNAQKAGAKLVLIADNNSENVHKIFPVERTKTLLDQIHVPSLLLSKIDGDQFKTAFELHSMGDPKEAYKHPIEISVHFDLAKSHQPTNLRFILQVDDPQSYQLIAEFAEYYRTFHSIINLRVHYKLFMNADLPFKNDECLMSGMDTYCIAKNPADEREIPGLISETIRQMCLYNHDYAQFTGYSGTVLKNCFQEDGLVRADFQECTNAAFAVHSTPEDREALHECMKFGSVENEILLQNNYEETKYFLINYSPLIFINGFYYKGNFDDTSHLMETICNSFEATPAVCSSLAAFLLADDTNYAKLIAFVSLAFAVCLVLMFAAVFAFYVIYKKKLRRQLVLELNEKVNKALLTFKDKSDRSSCRPLDVRSPAKSRVSVQ